MNGRHWNGLGCEQRRCCRYRTGFLSREEREMDRASGKRKRRGMITRRFERCGIRTRESLSGLPVLQTGAFSRALPTCHDRLWRLPIIPRNRFEYPEYSAKYIVPGITVSMDELYGLSGLRSQTGGTRQRGWSISCELVLFCGSRESLDAATQERGCSTSRKSSRQCVSGCRDLQQAENELSFRRLCRNDVHRMDGFVPCDFL